MTPGRLLFPLAVIAGVLLGNRPVVAQAREESPVDYVHLRLFRNEIRRWMQQGVIPDDDSFEDWAFGGELGELVFRRQLDTSLKKKLHSLSRVFQLSEGQRQKLRLAGHGDIKRLLEMIDASRSEFHQVRLDLRRLPELQKKLFAIDLRVSKGLFESGSILAKTLAKMNVENELMARPATTAR